MTCQRHVERNAHAASTPETILSKGTTQRGRQGKDKDGEQSNESGNEWTAMRNENVEMRVGGTKGPWTTEGKQWRV